MMKQICLKDTLQLAIAWVIYALFCFIGEGIFLKIFFLVSFIVWALITFVIYKRNKEPLVNEKGSDVRYDISVSILAFYLIPVVIYLKIIKEHYYLYGILIAIYFVQIGGLFVKTIREFLALRKDNNKHIDS